MQSKETDTVSLELTHGELNSLKLLVLNELKCGQKLHNAKSLKHLRDLALKKDWRFYKQLFDLRDTLSV